jgi:molecular chaperone DnaK
MARTTIDFGIDLGTTNSSIAKLNGTETEVIKNNEGSEYTPSVVWADKNKRLIVGRPAYERLVSDPDNAFSEFKTQMGTSTEYLFARNEQRMKPEDMSCEVLKSLKANVLQRTGEDLQAAVITVPAAFELPQNNATKCAAQLAGITSAPLLQEPIAAAMAYGFQSETEKAHWLVYDFGGGTFDAAIIQVRDGLIRPVNHSGDNHLGGKLIDWAIVDEILVPALVSQFSLSNFNRGNVKWRAAFAKLKLAAEAAKIRLSHYDSAEVSFDFLCNDDNGKVIEFDFDLHRSDIERLAEPFILRSINICKKALAEKKLASGNIEKVLLVGGPSLMPYLRERLLDEHEGLGVPLEFRIDPLTVVARGAAIFAGTQRLEASNAQRDSFSDKESQVSGQYYLEVEYEPIGADLDPQVGGRVSASEGESLSGFTIEFVNDEARPAWRSGKIALATNGGFVTTLLAERGKRNNFHIELFDATGTQCEIEPNNIHYTVGQTITGQPLTHNISIALANNKTDIFFEKGMPLPGRKTMTVKTAYDVRREQANEKIKIPVVEGENEKANRNPKIGHLEIPASKLKRDILAGSEIEVTLEMDASRIVTLEAYLPMLDQEFEATLNFDDYVKEAKNPDKLYEDFEYEKKRLIKFEKKAWEIDHTHAQKLIKEIQAEGIEHQFEKFIIAASADANAASGCHDCLLKLRAKLGAVEDLLEWPLLVSAAEDQMKETRRVVAQHGNDKDKQILIELERETRQAIESRDTDILRRKNDDLWRISSGIHWRQPDWVVDSFYYIEGRKATMSNSVAAERLIYQGRLAIDAGDLPRVRETLRELCNLLPNDEREEAEKKGYSSTVI